LGSRQPEIEWCSGASLSFDIPTGEWLSLTATEVLVEMKHPPQSVVGEPQPPGADSFRLRLAPEMSIV
jgi:hypothetical protein